MGIVFAILGLLMIGIVLFVLIYLFADDFNLALGCFLLYLVGAAGFIIFGLLLTRNLTFGAIAGVVLLLFFFMIATQDGDKKVFKAAKGYGLYFEGKGDDVISATAFSTGPYKLIYQFPDEAPPVQVILVSSLDPNAQTTLLEDTGKGTGFHFMREPGRYIIKLRRGKAQGDQESPETREYKWRLGFEPLDEAEKDKPKRAGDSNSADYFNVGDDGELS